MVYLINLDVIFDFLNYQIVYLYLFGNKLFSVVVLVRFYDIEQLNVLNEINIQCIVCYVINLKYMLFLFQCIEVEV